MKADILKMPVSENIDWDEFRIEPTIEREYRSTGYLGFGIGGCMPGDCIQKNSILGEQDYEENPGLVKQDSQFCDRM